MFWFFQPDQSRQTYASIMCSKKNVPQTIQIYSKFSCNIKLNKFLYYLNTHILTPNDDNDEDDVLNGFTK